jgi:hypothetical protein
MNAEEIQFGLSTVLSLIFGSGGALGVWFSMKGRIALLEQALEVDKDDIKSAHTRISDVKNKIEATDRFIQEVKLDMKAMENRIIREIHNTFQSR